LKNQHGQAQTFSEVIGNSAGSGVIVNWHSGEKTDSARDRRDSLRTLVYFFVSNGAFQLDRSCC